EGCGIVNLLDLAFRVTPTLRWADGHRVGPRGTGFVVVGHPSGGPRSDGAPTRCLTGKQPAGRQLCKRGKTPLHH
ncbi:MAG: hypothetical protein VXX57_01385, partial [Cyanobacteriota bacterium]|nr:hypothetical protein [Cyanobacteriota bacterium]